MANEVLILAYEAALAALREQDNTMSNLRNRATGLLAATAVGTSFATAVGVLHTNSSPGAVFPAWAGWTLLGLVTLVGVSVMIVLWPTSRWCYGPDPEKFLKSADKDIDSVRRTATSALVFAINANNRSIATRVLAYRIGATMLLVEVVILVLALLVNRE